MQAPRHGRWPALLLLPMLALLQGCTSSFGVLVATPAISPAGGSFVTAVTVVLTDTTAGASIFYTTDGSTPTPASTAYTGSFVLSQSTTVQAIATAPNDVKSQIAAAAFVITIPPAATPIFTPPAGTYTSTQSVTISDGTPGAAIYYTTNGSAPTTGSSLYTGPIAVSATETIEAIAVATGYGNSAVATAAYVINAPQTATPTFTPPAGTYTSSQSITISDATAGAVIYYTTDGTTPTTSSAVFSSPIYISASQTIEAIAVAPGYSNSAVAIAVYTIQIPVCTNTGPGIICTVAGDGIKGYSGDGGQAISAELYFAAGAAVDANLNLYIADTANNRVRKVTPAGVISTVAGNGTSGFSGDGGQATSAELDDPFGVALDSSGNLYIADTQNNRVRRVTPAGVISTVAGNGLHGVSGDGGPATSGELEPIGLALDSSGNLFIADLMNESIRKVTPAGIISTVAGNGTVGFSGDGGPATSAELDLVQGIAVDINGNLYIVDTLNYRIRKVTPAGIISTLAGNGTAGFSGDGGPATSAEMSPAGVAVDASGNLYIADLNNERIRLVTPAGIISTIAGNGILGYSGDNGPATGAALYSPRGVAVDTNGDIYIADYANHRIRKVFSTIAAPPTFAPPAGTYTSAQSVTIQDATPGASIYYTTDGSTPTTASTLFTSPILISAAETLNAFAVASGYANSRVVTAGYVIQLPSGACSTLASGSICTVAGNGVSGYIGDSGLATAAKLNTPLAVAVDNNNGNLYIADSSNHVIRMVTPAGTISTIAGNGKTAYTGDGGPATSAALSDPEGIAVDGSGNLYIADTNNQRIRMVTPAGIISTIAGNGTIGYTGDGAAALSAELYAPHGVSVDLSGNVYIADTSNNCIRKVTPAGIISTVAGNGTYGYGGDGGAGTSAQLSLPARVTAALSGDLYIADTYNNRVRKVTPAGIISTVAGNGTAGYSGDNAPATSVELFGPWGVAVDSSGNLYIADTDNQRIRKVIH